MGHIPLKPKNSALFPSIWRLAEQFREPAAAPPLDQLSGKANPQTAASEAATPMAAALSKMPAVDPHKTAKSLHALLSGHDAMDERCLAAIKAFEGLPWDAAKQVALSPVRGGVRGATLIEAQLMLWDNGLAAQALAEKAEPSPALSQATQRALANGPLVLPMLLAVYRNLRAISPGGAAIAPAINSLLRRCIQSHETIQNLLGESILQTLDTPASRERKVAMLHDLVALNPRTALATTAHDLVTLAVSQAVGPGYLDAAMAVEPIREYCAQYTHELVLAVAARRADMTLPHDRLGRRLGPVYDAVRSKLASPSADAQRVDLNRLNGIVNEMAAHKSVMSLDELHYLSVRHGLTAAE